MTAFDPLPLSEVSGTVPVGEALANVLSNPLSAVLLLCGALLLAFSVGVFAYVTAGAAVAGLAAE